MSPLQHAKRALVSLLMKKLAIFYAIVLNVDRESPDRAIHYAFKKISVKAHPDKGGKMTHPRAESSLNSLKGF